MAAATSPAWRIGDIVFVRGERRTIEDTRTWTDCVSLRVGAADAPARTLLIPFDRPRRIEQSRSVRIVRPRRFLHDVRRAAVGMHPFGGLRATAAAPIRLLPHQVAPALAMLRSGATRVLLADAVGLGKTIQAGILLLELSLRSDTFRCLVALPAGLRIQWARELSTHFQLTSIQADAAWLRAATAERPPDVNPWSLPGIYIVSLDFVKRPEVLRPLEDVIWDLLIVDEAHQASDGTDRRAAVHAIGRRSRRVLLLTATPHGDDPRQFNALCRIGCVDEREAPIVFFRRSRSDVSSLGPRRSAFLRVRLSAAEARMHQLLEGYTRRVWIEAARRGDTRARLVSIVLRKRALSSAASLAASVRRRMELLSTPADAGAVQLSLPLEDEDPLGDAEPGEALAAPGLSDPRRERRWLASIAEVAQHAARDESKARRLIRLLARLREPALVFTEYRDTLGRLERALRASNATIVVLHGGMSPAERAQVQDRFNRGGVTLLATDAAAEGLNLHHHCRVIIHYELPWSLTRIEQRAGRVDRLGQQRRVHEIALVASDTAEKLVLAPLAARALRAHAIGIGSANALFDALSEAAVADVVMDGLIPETTGDAVQIAHLPIATFDLDAEAVLEVHRLETFREWHTQSPAPRRARAGRPITVIDAERSGASPGALLLYTISVRSNDSRVIHAEPVVLHTTVDARRLEPCDRTSARTLVSELVESPSLKAVLDRIVARVAASIGDAHQRWKAAISRRDEYVKQALPSAAHEIVQAGLFDRRALRDASTRAQIAVGRFEDLNARAEEHTALTTTAEWTAAAVVRSRRR